MTSPKGSSPKPGPNPDSPRMERLKTAIKQGKWPPPGFPWRSLYANPSQADQTFRSPGWQALERDLTALKDREVDALLYKVTTTEQLYESRGLAKAIDLILALPGEFSVYSQAEEKKVLDNS